MPRNAGRPPGVHLRPPLDVRSPSLTRLAHGACAAVSPLIYLTPLASKPAQPQPQQQQPMLAFGSPLVGGTAAENDAGQEAGSASCMGEDAVSMRNPCSSPGAAASAALDSGEDSGEDTEDLLLGTPTPLPTRARSATAGMLEPGAPYPGLGSGQDLTQVAEAADDHTGPPPCLEPAAAHQLLTSASPPPPAEPVGSCVSRSSSGALGSAGSKPTGRSQEPDASGTPAPLPMLDLQPGGSGPCPALPGSTSEADARSSADTGVAAGVHAADSPFYSGVDQAADVSAHAGPGAQQAAASGGQAAAAAGAAAVAQQREHELLARVAELAAQVASLEHVRSTARQLAEQQVEENLRVSQAAAAQQQQRDQEQQRECELLAQMERLAAQVASLELERGMLQQQAEQQAEENARISEELACERAAGLAAALAAAAASAAAAAAAATARQEEQQQRQLKEDEMAVQVEQLAAQVTSLETERATLQQQAEQQAEELARERAIGAAAALAAAATSAAAAAAAAAARQEELQQQQHKEHELTAQVERLVAQVASLESERFALRQQAEDFVRVSGELARVRDELARTAAGRDELARSQGEFRAKIAKVPPGSVVARSMQVHAGRPAWPQTLFRFVR